MLLQDTTHVIKDHITNKEVCAKVQQAIGPHEDHLTIVKGCKLQWYGHVSRSCYPATMHFCESALHHLSCYLLSVVGILFTLHGNGKKDSFLVRTEFFQNGA